MSNYSEKLRRERRAELARRALPEEMFNEYGEAFAASKTEDGKAFPAAAYAYVPDPEMPSTWKLRLWATPDGGPDARIIGAAIAALGEGFRGNKVQIPSEDLSAVKAKVLAAWKKVHDADEEPPAVIACGEAGHDYDEGLGYRPAEGSDREFLEALLPHHAEILDLITKAEFKDPAVAEYAGKLAKKLVSGSAEIRGKLDISFPEPVEALEDY